MVSVAALQLRPRATESHTERLRAIEAALRGVTADLIVLPELWPTGFFAFDRYVEDAEVLPGRTVDLLARVAAYTGSWIAAGSVIELSQTGVHNTALVVDPAGRLAGRYRKIHLFSFQSREAELLTAGAETCVVDTPWGKLGISLCYDLRFPELYRNLVVSQGAEIIVVCAAWPASRASAWKLLLQARAVENQAFVIGCAAAGDDSGVRLGGSSMIIDPSGEVLAQAGDRPETIQADLDVASLRSLRASFPVLNDRVAGAFGG